MGNRKHLEILGEGPKAWNRWRMRNPNIRPDLSVSDLRGVDFRNAELWGTSLVKADLRQANLQQVNLSYANFSLASLVEADLSESESANTNFSHADLSHAKLCGTQLFGAQFFGTDLMHADMRNAKAGGTIFAGLDLSSVQGLETMTHHSSSTIGTDTLLLSEGRIPRTFLQGAGLPDEVIDYFHASIQNPIQFNSCFISYSTADQEFAERLYVDLQANGVRCWFAPYDVQAGRKLYDQIDEAIRIHERLLLILSTSSIQSPWVKTEITRARSRETSEMRQVLFPIRLVEFHTLKNWVCFDADTGIDSAKEIREYFIPDFSNWKNFDSYQIAFSKLLKDLRQGQRIRVV